MAGFGPVSPVSPESAAQPLAAEGKSFALVVQPAIRVAIRKLVRTCLPDTPVMSFFEVPEEKAVEVVAVIGAGFCGATLALHFEGQYQLWFQSTRPHGARRQWCSPT